VSTCEGGWRVAVSLADGIEAQAEKLSGMSHRSTRSTLRSLARKVRVLEAEVVRLKTPVAPTPGYTSRVIKFK